MQSWKSGNVQLSSVTDFGDIILQCKPPVPEQLHESGPSLPCVSETQFVRWGSEHL